MTGKPWRRSRSVAVKWSSFLAVACLLSGCRTADRTTPGAPTFQDLYRQLQADAATPAERPEEPEEPRLSITADQTPLPQFLRMLATETGASIVTDASLDTATITVELHEQPLSEVLGVVARRVGADLTRKGEVYYLGNLKPSDVGVLVRRSPRLPPEQLKTAVDVFRSSIGRSLSYEGGLLVVGDRVEVLQQINDMLDRLEAMPSVTWVVQLHVVEMSERDVAELGLDLEPALDLAVTFGAASSSIAGAAAGVARAAQLKGGLSAILKAAAESETMRIVADPLFLVADGSEASYTRGSTIPVPRRVVTEGGAVETAGYDAIRAGFDVRLSVREVGPERLRLKLDFAADEVERFVEERPIVKGEQLHAEADLVSGGVYLVGSMRREREGRTWAKLLRLGGRKETEASVLHVYARAYRVAGGLPAERSRPRPEAAGGATPAEPQPVASGQAGPQDGTENENPGE